MLSYLPFNGCEEPSILSEPITPRLWWHFNIDLWFMCPHPLLRHGLLANLYLPSNLHVVDGSCMHLLFYCYSHPKVWPGAVQKVAWHNVHHTWPLDRSHVHYVRLLGPVRFTEHSMGLCTWGVYLHIRRNHLYYSLPWTLCSWQVWLMWGQPSDIPFCRVKCCHSSLFGELLGVPSKTINGVSYMGALSFNVKS